MQDRTARNPVTASTFIRDDAEERLARFRDATPRRSLWRDAVLRAGWRSCVLLMILTAGLLSVSLSYRAIFALISGAWPSSATLAIVSILAGVGVKWLCEHRNELVET